MNRKKNNPLPIHEKYQEIISTLKREQVLVVVGETGSGKTTQLPQFCLKAGFGKKGSIAVTQPRRIAATAMATRVAEELNTTLGAQVGYKIRFYEKQSGQTNILFMTDGILLNEILSDRLLKKYQTIIIDEAHERSINIDFLLGYLRKILPKRPDLKVIISSATIDPTLFSKAFDKAPIIEVSGRLFPVEVWYQPIDQELLDAGKITYVDAAVQAVEEIVGAGDPGDILVFMPTERDIRETIQLLDSRKLAHTITLPLFARLTRYAQNRIFSHFNKRKIVVATNIAETSLTVPGIRYVIDTGLARIKSYAPNLRANRLPIEAIPQASANQRKGRCGRVAEGLCIRLYSEEDYTHRNTYSIPEIRRSNLAGVILTMLELRLGSIETFPFIEPPGKRAIQDAFAQLRELGALNENRELTKLGRQMARIPLEPHIARMVIQARGEKVQQAVLIIAAGLSIVDPRERPFDKKDEANEMHKRFVDQRSDFLTLLQLWQHYQKTWETLGSQSKVRRFCKEHYLSYNRMQEWHDVHQQISQVLRDARFLKSENKRPSTDAIHRSILAGLITNVAKIHEKEGYTATKNRQVFIFPGSTLFKKGVPWIMCHEIVETSRVYARTTAPIKPIWLEELAPALCRYSYSDPYFDEATMSTRVKERVLFFGLPIIEGRIVAFRRIDSEAATELFIREALVNLMLRTKHRFYLHNKRVIERLRSAEAKVRKPGSLVDDEKIVAFYKKRLRHVSSLQDLTHLIGKRKSDRFLYLQEKDISIADVPDQVKEFHDTLSIGHKHYPLEYICDPGAKEDGLTVTVPIQELSSLQQETFGWLVPALWEEKIRYLLKSLPKSIRKQFVPIPQHAPKIAQAMQYEPAPFNQVLCNVIRSQYGITIPEHTFSEEELPNHLRMRIKVVAENKKTLAIERNLQKLQKESHTKSVKRTVSETVYKKFEKQSIEQWDFGDIPERIEVVRSKKGYPLYGYPAVVPSKRCVDLKLFATSDEAAQNHPLGVKKLLQHQLQKEFAWLERDLRFSKLLKIESAPFGGESVCKKSLFKAIVNHVTMVPSPPPTTAKAYAALYEKSIVTLKGLGHKALMLLEEMFKLARENITLIEKLATKSNLAGRQKIKRELQSCQESYLAHFKEGALLFSLFLQYPRYFKALTFRIEKAFLAPAAYQERMNKLLPFIARAETIRGGKDIVNHMNRHLLLEYLHMVEEYAISLFAQQSKTLYPISEKRLLKKLTEIDQIEQ